MACERKITGYSLLTCRDFYETMLADELALQLDRHA